jgi:hypothetical protein
VIALREIADGLVTSSILEEIEQPAAEELMRCSRKPPTRSCPYAVFLSATSPQNRRKAVNMGTWITRPPFCPGFPALRAGTRVCAAS